MSDVCVYVSLYVCVCVEADISFANENRPRPTETCPETGLFSTV